MSDDRLKSAFLTLSSVMRRLRAGCPWDARQTHASLRRYLIEECHEVLDALDRGDPEDLRAELGDLLFQVWFHSEIASEREGGFDLADVLDGIARKLVRRHPHVFEESGGGAEGEEAWSRAAWERRKMSEGRTSRLEGLPSGLPALLQAQILQEKAASAGFDWPDHRGVLDKVREECAELEEELAAAASSGGAMPTPGMAHELGDLLFTLVNLARKLDLNAEDALRMANRRFRKRFQYIERAVAASNRPIEDVDLDELERLWQEAKAAE